jgi:hypothetical protein
MMNSNWSEALTRYQYELKLQQKARNQLISMFGSLVADILNFSPSEHAETELQELLDMSLEPNKSETAAPLFLQGKQQSTSLLRPFSSILQKMESLQMDIHNRYFEQNNQDVGSFAQKPVDSKIAK